MANRQKAFLRGLVITVTLIALPFLLLILYLALWGVFYRFPHSPIQAIDLRNDPTQTPYYVAICAALADNPHGFPGHGYVLWSETDCIDLLHSPSAGYVPSRFSDQIPALFHPVAGVVVRNAAQGNLRNFDTVIAIVDGDVYQKSIQASRLWQAEKFKVGSRDCVAYVHSIASTIGLATPDPLNQYPQDYVSQLKNLNKNAFADTKIIQSPACSTLYLCTPQKGSTE